MYPNGQPVMITNAELKTIITRANKNLEDIPKLSWFSKLFLIINKITTWRKYE